MTIDELESYMIKCDNLWYKKWYTTFIYWKNNLNKFFYNYVIEFSFFLLLLSLV